MIARLVLPFQGVPCQFACLSEVEDASQRTSSQYVIPDPSIEASMAAMYHPMMMDRNLTNVVSWILARGQAPCQTCLLTSVHSTYNLSMETITTSEVPEGREEVAYDR